MNDYFAARKECPCCGSTNSIEICRTPYNTSPIRDYLISFYSPQGGVEFKYLHDQDYILVECANCSLIFQSEIPCEFLALKVYEEWIEPDTCFNLYERPRKIDFYSHLSSEIIEIIKYFNSPPMELKFLDFSMGWGHWCRIAQSFGCVVDATEFSKARIKYARSKGVHVINSTEIATNQYDFINTEQVFEHLPEIRLTLKSLKDSLKPNGILKISVPNGWNIKKRLNTWNWSAPKGNSDSLNPIAPLEHINCFNHFSLVQLAQDAGLVQVNAGRILSHQHSSGINEIVKAFLRPYWHLMKRTPNAPAGKGTYLLFRSSDHL